jgi:hypothetical protein
MPPGCKFTGSNLIMGKNMSWRFQNYLGGLVNTRQHWTTDSAQKREELMYPLVRKRVPGSGITLESPGISI